MKGNRLVRDVSGFIDSMAKLPPQAIDLEEAVLGAILIDRRAIHEVVDILQPEDFYREQHQEIYRACLTLYQHGHPIDMMTAVNKLRELGKLEIVGGSYYIADITSRISSASNIQYHARIITEYKIKRELIQQASSMHHLAYEDTTDAFELLGDAQSKLDGIGGKYLKGNFQTSLAISQDVIKKIGLRLGQGGITGVATHLKQVDKVTGGWQNTDLTIIGARPGMGKGLDLNELLMTPSGWIKMKDVKIGDLLSGSDGKFYPVTGVYPQGVKRTFTVTFDDKSKVLCDDEHLWFTQTRADRKQVKGSKKGSVKNIIEIKNSIMSGNRKNHSIQFTQPIEFEHKETLVHPYILGIMIGDGGMSDKANKLHNPEVDVLKKFKSLLPKGYSLSNPKDKLNHGIKSNGNKNFGLLIPELQGCRSYEKYIPALYLYNSIENRIQLLRGLMDSDGHVSLNKCGWIEYSTTSEKLCEHVIDLVRGLGGRASFISRMGRYTKDGVQKTTRINFRIFITFANGIVPVSSKKHLARYKAKRHAKKFIKSVIENGFRETQCISVDSPDKLFLTTGHTLTHNTAMLMTAALNAAMIDRIPTAFFSLEMSAEQLMIRAYSGIAKIENTRIFKNLIDEDEHFRILEAGTQMDCPLFIDDTPAITIMEFRARARRLVHDQGVKIIFVDYLQLMKGDGNEGNRVNEIGTISRGLKRVAKEMNIPVIAACQLSRAVEGRSGEKRPNLSDLRESGDIEQDADLVMFLYRPEYYKIMKDERGNSTEGLLELIIAKHRNGGLDTIPLRYIGKYTQVVNFETQEQLPIPVLANSTDELPF